MNLKKVIFDMDGLIFDSERIFMNEETEVMKDYGYILTEEKYVKTLGLTGETLLNQMRSMYGADYPFTEISQKSRARVNNIALSGGLPIKYGIIPLLDFLTQKNIPCCVASSTHRKYVEQYLSAAGLRKYFTAVIGGDSVSHSKPEPDIFLAALGDTNPADALVLEDSTNGIIAAHRANIPVICIPDMLVPNEETGKLTLSVVSSALDVINIIKEGEIYHDKS